MNGSCNDLCCAIKKACRMVWPAYEDTAWIMKVMNFVLEKWAAEDCPEVVEFPEDELLKVLFRNKQEIDLLFRGKQSTDFAVNPTNIMLKTFFQYMDVHVEEEAFEDGGCEYWFSDTRIICNYIYDEGTRTHGFRMADETFCDMVRDDRIGRSMTVSCRRRDVEVRVEVYD